MLFQAPPPRTVSVLLSGTSLVVRPGTPMMFVKPSPAAIISGLRFQMSALMITSRRSTRYVYGSLLARPADAGDPLAAATGTAATTQIDSTAAAARAAPKVITLSDANSLLSYCK